MHMGCFWQAHDPFVSTFLAYVKGCTNKQPLKLSHGKTNPWLVNESPLLAYVKGCANNNLSSFLTAKEIYG